MELPPLVWYLIQDCHQDSRTLHQQSNTSQKCQLSYFHCGESPFILQTFKPVQTKGPWAANDISKSHSPFCLSKCLKPAFQIPFTWARWHPCPLATIGGPKLTIVFWSALSTDFVFLIYGPVGQPITKQYIFQFLQETTFFKGYLLQWFQQCSRRPNVFPW